MEVANVKLGRSDIFKLNPHAIEFRDEFNGRYFAVSEREIYDLALNLLGNGQKQPIKVRKFPGEERYELISGFTRLKAVLLINTNTTLREKANLSVQDVYPVQALSVKVEDNEAFVENVIENFWRINPTVVDQAYVHDRLRDMGKSGKEISQICGCSESWVSQLKGLLNLPEDILRKVHTGELSMTDAMNGLTEPPAASPPVLRTTPQRPKIKRVKELLEDYSSIEGFSTLRLFLDGKISEAEFCEIMDTRVEDSLVKET